MIEGVSCDTKLTVGLVSKFNYAFHIYLRIVCRLNSLLERYVFYAVVVGFIADSVVDVNLNLKIIWIYLKIFWIGYVINWFAVCIY